MATEFLNDARKEIEGRTEDFCGELKAFYQGNGEAEQNLMEQTTQPFWQSLRLSRKRRWIWRCRSRHDWRTMMVPGRMVMIIAAAVPSR